MNRLTEQVWFKDIHGDKVAHLNSNGFEWFVKPDISQQQVVNKLGRIENILEEHKVESLEELDKILKSRDKLNKLKGYLFSEKEETEALINNFYAEDYEALCNIAGTINKIIDKISEFEGE